MTRYTDKEYPDLPSNLLTKLKSRQDLKGRRNRENWEKRYAFVKMQYKLLPRQLAYMINLTSRQQSLLTEYTSKIGFAINSALRKMDSSRHSEVVSALDEIFAQAPAITKPLILYRGTKGFQIPQVFQEHAYLSTTFEFDKTRLFIQLAHEAVDHKMCCIYEITVPRGYKVLPLATISKIAGENEALLPRDTVLVVTSVETRYMSKNIPDLATTIIHCTAVSPIVAQCLDMIGRQYPSTQRDKIIKMLLTYIAENEV